MTTSIFEHTLPDEPVSPDAMVGERVAVMMRRKRMTQKVMADQLGVTQATISRKLLGERPWTLTELGRVAVVLGVSPEQLVQHLDWLVKNQEGWLVRHPGLEPGTRWLSASTPDELLVAA